MPTLLDAFNSKAFDMLEMTAAVNKQPFVPGRAGSLGIFESRGVTTTQIMIEEQSGTLVLVPKTERGAPPNQNKHAKRVARSLVVPHLPMEDTIMASEIQNVRAFGSTELQGVEEVRNQRLNEMRNKIAATIEYQRIGAIKGVLLDSDGSTTIYNLFTEFGVSQDTVDFVLGTSTTDILGKTVEVAGLIEDELGAAVYDHIHVFAGKTWWAKFIAHAKVTDAYKYFEARGQRYNPNRDDMRYRGFEFGGVVFEQYRGKVGGISFIADSEAYAFPVGVPGLFQTAFAPADFLDTVNTVGLPMYSKAEMMKYERGVNVLVESNPLSICTRPKVLIKLSTSN
jgi:hypothetical protein